jgi:hypothetical protein
MSPIALGRVNVTTPGTNVPLAAVSTPCKRIRVQVIAGLTGKMYFGTTQVKGSTLAGVIKELCPNSAGGVDDSFDLQAMDAVNVSCQLNLADYAIDAAVGGEGLIVTYWP